VPKKAFGDFSLFFNGSGLYQVLGGLTDDISRFP